MDAYFLEYADSLDVRKHSGKLLGTEAFSHFLYCVRNRCGPAALIGNLPGTVSCLQFTERCANPRADSHSGGSKYKYQSADPRRLRRNFWVHGRLRAPVP